MGDDFRAAYDHAPFPLEGGRAGDGGAGSAGLNGSQGRADVVGGVDVSADSVVAEASPPSPALPPSRGKGGIARARRLRKQSTLAERILWQALRGLKQNFRRQVPIGRYVADFAHHESKLLIEIDGYYHRVEGVAERDAARDAWLVSEGFRVLRFSEHAVRDDVDRVVERILTYTVLPSSPAFPPSRGKGEESAHA